MLSIDVRQILDHYNIDYEEKKNSDELYFLCPFHNDTNFGSALFNETTTEWNCFSCKMGGNVYKFVMELENCDFKRAKTLIESDFNDNIYDIESLKVKFERAEKRNQKPPKSSKEAAIVVHKFLDAFIQRNPPLEFIQKWYTVCVHLIYVGNMTEKDFDKQYLQFYTQFFSELNQEKS